MNSYRASNLMTSISQALRPALFEPDVAAPEEGLKWEAIADSHSEIENSISGVLYEAVELLGGALENLCDANGDENDDGWYAWAESYKIVTDNSIKGQLYIDVHLHRSDFDRRTGSVTIDAE